MTTVHSIADPCDPEVSPTNNRHLTVSYASRYPDYTRIPALTMKGQWLPQPEESELMQSLRQVSKLSARKQKQVQAFIDVMAGSK